MGQAARPSVPTLLEALRDPDVPLGGSTFLLFEAILTLDPSRGPEAVAGLFHRTSGGKTEVVDRTLAGLHGLAIPALLRTVADPAASEPLRSDALYNVAQQVGWPKPADEATWPWCRSEIEAVLPALRRAAHEGKAFDRQAALRILISADPDEDVVAGLLLEQARDGIDWLPETASLPMSLSLGPPALPVLVNGLEDRNADVRALATSILACPDDNPEPDSDPKGFVAALRDEAVTGLIGASRDRDTLVRWNAALALGSWKQDPKRAIPALVAVLEAGGDEPVRRGAWIRLQAAWDWDKGGGGVIVRAADWEDRVRLAALQALIEYESDAEPTVPALIRAAAAADARTRWYAAQAVAAIGPRAKDAVPALVALLDSKELVTGVPERGDRGDHEVRTDGLALMAAWALGRLGPDARAALGALEQSAKDADPALREVALEAIARIRQRSSR
jgi:HEAT repeat protein